MTEDSAPLLVTLTMDDTAFAHFNAERQRHFPPERNHLPAHITLFHALPGREIETVTAVLEAIAGRTPVFAMATDGLMFLGGGSAYTLAAPPALALRQELASAFAAWLTPQDATRGFRPHITVQNKVEGNLAKILYADLTSAFQPMALTAMGVDLWYYRGGPWEFIRHFPFAPPLPPPKPESSGR